MYKFTKNSLDFFNKFKFKKFQSMNTQDGVAYSCDLFFERRKIATVENQGDGGMSIIDYVDGGKDFFRSLDLEQYHDTTDITFRITCEYLIEDLIETQIYLKDVLKGQGRSILFVDKDGKIMQISYRYSLNKIKEGGKISIVKKKVDEIVKEGGIILNTNFGRLGI